MIIENEYKKELKARILSLASTMFFQNGIRKPKSVIRDSFLLFLMTAIRKSQLYLSDCQ